MTDDRIGLPSGRGAEAGGKCLLAQCPHAATGTIVSFHVPGYGNVRGHVCPGHEAVVRQGTLSDLSIAVEENRRPARPE